MALVDDNQASLIEASDNIFTLEEIRQARVIVSLNEKLYGRRLSVTQVAHENKVHRQMPERDSEDVFDN